MSWNLTGRLDEFDAAAGEYLRASATRNTLPLSIMAELGASGSGAYGDMPPYFGWFTVSGQVMAACLRTPPHALVVTGLDQAAAVALASALASFRPDTSGPAAGSQTELSGVTGRDDEAYLFAAAWLGSSGREPRVRMRNRLYRLDRLAPPAPWPDGAARRASLADRELATAWYGAFASEVGESSASSAVIEGKLREGRLVIWELAGGTPVAMAGRNRNTSGVARVGPVYTPPDQRGRGYGSAATAAVSQHALDDGVSEVVLFTDLANPVSNSIYQRLGYRPVEDKVSLAF